MVRGHAVIAGGSGREHGIDASPVDVGIAVVGTRNALKSWS